MVKTSKRHKTDKRKRTRKTRKSRKDLVINRAHLWLFRIVTIILIPVILLGLVEAGLRIFDYGYSTNTFSTCQVLGKKAYCNNTQFAWQFFPRDIARDFSPFVFFAKKPSDTYRIFVLGASAVQGVPEPAFSFGRILEVLLKQTYPQYHFEVISLAMPAINSHAVLEITQDCLKHQPDLLVVYLGNNEVVGPYGAGTVFSPLISNRLLIRTSIKLKSIRIVQLLSNLLYLLRSNSGQAQQWRGMEMFLGHQVRAQEPRLNQVYKHFRANLTDICNLAAKKGVPILVSTVAINLKDCPPFASQHRIGISDEQLQQWELEHQHGLDCEKKRDYEGAIQAYQDGLILDPDYAETHFRLGRCYWETQQYEQASQAYRRACEFDTLRFRADQQINQIIRDSAQEKQKQGVYFIDTAKVISAHSEQQVPGRQWFYEHVHFNFSGNYLLAKIMFEQIEPLLPRSLKKDNSRNGTIPNEQQCADALCYTILEQYKITKKVLENYITRAPFTNQAYHSQAVRQLESYIQLLKDRVDKIPFESFLEKYRQSIERNPSDWQLRWIYASLLASEQVNDQAKALQQYQIVHEKLPLWSAPYAFMGLAASKMGKLDKGIDYNKKAIALDHTQFEAYFNLGFAYQLQQKYEQAIKNYHLAIRYQPEHASAYLNLGVILFNQGKIEQAIETYITGQENIPDYPELYYNLGVIYEKTGNIDNAVEQYRKAIDINPDSTKYRKALDLALNHKNHQ
jgi:tetratricopeptide (TPR) repeat protein